MADLSKLVLPKRSKLTIMKTDHRSILTRSTRAALRVRHCRYRVVAIGIDHYGKFIGISTNSPRLSTRSWHAEERLIHKSPNQLSTILLARFGASGRLLPIDPCVKCSEMARKRGIKIMRLEDWKGVE